MTLRVHTKSTVIDLDTLTGQQLPNEGVRYPQIRITDIAHSLSNLCRFNGSTKRFYSVAEHSVLVYRRVCEYDMPVRLRLRALFHDASETYVGDLIGPIKHQLLRDEMEMAANALDDNIWRVLRIPGPVEGEKAFISSVDKEVALHEFEHVMSFWSGDKGLEAWPECRIRFLEPSKARRLFMSKVVKEITCLRQETASA